MEEAKTKIDVKKVLIVLGLILLTAGAVGGGVWYVLNQNFQKERETNEKAVRDLETRLKKVEDEKTAKKEETSNIPTSNTNTTTTNQNVSNLLTYDNTSCHFRLNYPKTYKITEQGARNAYISSANFFAVDHGFDAICSSGEISLIKNYTLVTKGVNTFRKQINNDQTISYMLAAKTGALIILKMEQMTDEQVDEILNTVSLY